VLRARGLLVHCKLVAEGDGGVGGSGSRHEVGGRGRGAHQTMSMRTSRARLGSRTKSRPAPGVAKGGAVNGWLRMHSGAAHWQQASAARGERGGRTPPQGEGLRRVQAVVHPPGPAVRCGRLQVSCRRSCSCAERCVSPAGYAGLVVKLGERRARSLMLMMEGWQLRRRAGDGARHACSSIRACGRWVSPSQRNYWRNSGGWRAHQ
jgi:hypothetical protein